MTECLKIVRVITPGPPGPAGMLWTIDDYLGENLTALDDAAEGLQEGINRGYGTLGPGQYKIKSPLRWKPGVNLQLQPNTIVSAEMPMEHMLDTDIGDANRIRKNTIMGGLWDAKFNAQNIFTLRDFNDVKINDCFLHNCNGNYVEVDGTGAFSTCYGLMMRGVDIQHADNSQGPYAPGCNGIKCGVGVLGLSDAQFTDMQISGVERGMTGGIYGAKIYGVHVWGHGPSQGQVQYGFRLEGANTHVIGCQVDNPALAGYYIGGDQHYLIGSRVNYSGAFIVDDVAAAVEIGGAFHTTVIGCEWQANNATQRLKTDFTGNFLYLQAWGNKWTEGNIINPVGDFGPAVFSRHCNITPVGGTGDPTINANRGFSSIQAVGDGDYAFNFAVPVPRNDRYAVLVDIIPQTYPARMVPVIRLKNTVQLRIQTFDEVSGTFARPAILNVSMIGGY